MGKKTHGFRMVKSMQFDDLFLKVSWIPTYCGWKRNPAILHHQFRMVESQTKLWDVFPPFSTGDSDFATIHGSYDS